VTVPSSEDLALALRESHPDVQPLEAEFDAVAHWIRAAGGDGDDPAVVAATIVAWEALL
jgi:Fe-S-cluster formation regulator IscX/YfhJ